LVKELGTGKLLHDKYSDNDKSALVTSNDQRSSNQEDTSLFQFLYEKMSLHKHAKNRMNNNVQIFASERLAQYFKSVIV
jgi:hypothetical protein